MTHVPPTTPILPARCWCAVTPHGTLIPWTCNTDREQVLDTIRKAVLGREWRPVPVTITADEDDE